MTGSDRRADIIQQIKESRTPVSGTKLALRYEVSRQVIVQDIALKSRLTDFGAFRIYPRLVDIIS